jgi:hypothetical protein
MDESFKVPDWLRRLPIKLFNENQSTAPRIPAAMHVVRKAVSKRIKFYISKQFDRNRDFHGKTEDNASQPARPGALNCLCVVYVRKNNHSAHQKGHCETKQKSAEPPETGVPIKI